MKIIYLSSAVIPSESANSIQVMKMCEAFVQEGHEVRLLVPSWAGASDRLDEGALANRYGLRNPIGTVWYALRGRLSAGKSFVFTRDPVLAAICILLGARTVLEMHQLPEAGAPRRGLRFAARRSGNGRVNVVAITSALRNGICRQAGVADESMVIVAPDTVDIEVFDLAPVKDDARRLLGVPEDVPAVGYVGSLYPGRGVEVVIEVAKRLPSVRFLIVGGGMDWNASNNWSRHPCRI